MKTKTILCISFALCSAASAQQLDKKSLLGKYIDQTRKGDTTSSYLFFSNDSFKIIYGVEVLDGKDFYSPMVEGTWILSGGIVELTANDGHKKKAVYHNTSITVDDKIDSIPILNMEGRTYIDLMKKVKPPMKL